MSIQFKGYNKHSSLTQTAFTRALLIIMIKSFKIKHHTSAHFLEDAVKQLQISTFLIIVKQAKVN